MNSVTVIGNLGRVPESIALPSVMTGKGKNPQILL